VKGRKGAVPDETVGLMKPAAATSPLISYREFQLRIFSLPCVPKLPTKLLQIHTMLRRFPLADEEHGMSAVVL